MDRRDHLQVKVMSLAAEARIIRRKERAIKKHGPLLADTERKGRFLSLQDHRKGIVRREARNSLLAYALIRGTPYGWVEENPKTAPDWNRITTLVASFTGPAWATKQRVPQAKDAVKAWANAVAPARPLSKEKPAGLVCNCRGTYTCLAHDSTTTHVRQAAHG